jgi:hypothetical protein
VFVSTGVVALGGLAGFFFAAGRVCFGGSGAASTSSGSGEAAVLLVTTFKT